jgi:hypothetical protein
VLSLLPWGRRGAPAPTATPRSRRARRQREGDAGSDGEEDAVETLRGRAVCGLHDPPRAGRALLLSPACGLAAASDSLGRVLLFDLRAPQRLQAIRLWKGYRDAQLAWAALPAREEGRQALLLLIHCARRGGMLEAWRVPGGARTARLRVGRNCRLLAPPPLLGVAAGAGPAGGRPLVLQGCDGRLMVVVCSGLGGGDAAACCCE